MRALRKRLLVDETWLELIDERDVFDALFDHLANEDEASLSIPVFAMEVSDLFPGAGRPVLYQILNQFGQTVHGVLLDFGAYRNGVLPYVYERQYGFDMLLVEDLDESLTYE